MSWRCGGFTDKTYLLTMIPGDDSYSMRKASQHGIGDSRAPEPSLPEPHFLENIVHQNLGSQREMTESEKAAGLSLPLQNEKLGL